MNRTGLKKMLAVGVAVLGLSFCATQANAGWWWGAAPAYGCGCGCGGWDYCGAVTCGSCYSGCGCGCHHRVHHCGYGCGCSTCCDTCVSCWAPTSCCGGCGTSVSYWGSPMVSSYGCGCGTVTAPTMAPADGSMPAPAGTPTPAPAKSSNPAAASPSAGPTPGAPSTPAPSPPAGPAPSSSGPAPTAPGDIPIPLPAHSTSIEPTAADSAILTAWVPYEAKVTINGMLTKSTGSKRHFVSYGLVPGYTYKYEVKAEIVREGKIVTESQTISLTAGERGGVAFGFNIPPAIEGVASADSDRR